MHTRLECVCALTNNLSDHVKIRNEIRTWQKKTPKKRETVVRGNGAVIKRFCALYYYVIRNQGINYTFFMDWAFWKVIRINGWLSSFGATL